MSCFFSPLAVVDVEPGFGRDYPRIPTTTCIDDVYIDNIEVRRDTVD